MKLASAISLLMLTNTLLSQIFYSEYSSIIETFPKNKIDLQEIVHSGESGKGNLDQNESSSKILVKSTLSIYSNCFYAFIKITITETNLSGTPVGKKVKQPY